MRAKCLIIDDEALARDVLEKYISKVDALELVHQSKSALDALSYLAQNRVDIIFLDINMPELNGLEMLKTLQNPPKVIITTAYSEFALESYEYDIVDYLLKPIQFERFVKAVNRVIIKNISSKDVQNDDDYHETDIQSVFIKENNVIQKIDFKDILYLEAYGNYLKIITPSQNYVTRGTLIDFEKKLPATQFIKIHKSFLVAISKIKKLEGNRLFVGNSEIPVGHLYKNDLIKKLNI